MDLTLIMNGIHFAIIFGVSVIGFASFAQLKAMLQHLSPSAYLQYGRATCTSESSCYC